MRVFAISDLHVDFAENRRWVWNLSRHDYRDDLLILAGDVSSDLSRLTACLKGLVSRFEAVCFVPGNHDLWITGSDAADSFEKFCRIDALAHDLGVWVEPYRTEGLAVVPLLGWYDFSFGEPDVSLRGAWRDFRRCRWPARWTVSGVTDRFLERNEGSLEMRGETVVSFSHFLPRIDLLPARVPERGRLLGPVLGSVRLGAQVDRLRPSVHVYGHSHINHETTLGATRYVNNAFGYPAETRIARKRLVALFDAA